MTSVRYDWKKYYNTLPGGILIYRADDEEKILFANDKMLELFACDTEEEFDELTGGSFRGVVCPEDLETAELDIQDQIDNSAKNFDHVNYRIKTKRGDVVNVEDFGQLINDPELGPLFYVFVVDSRAKYDSYMRDSLTGTMGKFRFLEKLEALWDGGGGERPEEYAIIYFNLVNFKFYNVSFGMEAGDGCLRKVALALQEEFPGDAISRFSDDHFVVCSARQDLAETIGRVHERVCLIGGSANLHIKAGIRYLEPKDRETAGRTVCDQARIACDAIKTSATQYCLEFSEELSQEVELRTFITGGLDNAMEKGHIQVYYQPVVRTLTGKLCSMEALTRWIDPKRGFLSPGTFIPVLERTHLIHKLDIYVIHEVCRHIRRRMDAGEAIVPISFNLSRIDFATTTPFEEVERAAEAYRVPREYLRVEITETALMKDRDLIQREMDKFQKGGYQVWMDDFGSGYSSLNILKECSFDELKIDMAFLRNLNERGEYIITCVVDMAKKLGIHTLAEGVETKNQLDFLRSIGCEKIQGFYYGRPMPEEQLTAYCREKNIEAESRGEERIYDQVGKANLITDIPLALLKEEGDRLTILYENEECRRMLKVEGLAGEDSSFPETLRSLLRRMAVKARMSGQEERKSCAVKGWYLRICVETLAGQPGLYIHRVCVYDVVRDQGEQTMD